MSLLSLSKFELGERRCFAGEYSWRLKDGELRYRGSKHYEGLIVGRIPVTEVRIQKFAAALDLLDVWHWRNDYHPHELGVEVMDGGSWSFKAEISGRTINAAGCNAFPAFEDARLSTCNEERFRLLKAAFYDAFQIDGFIYAAQRQAEIAKQIQAERDANS